MTTLDADCIQSLYLIKQGIPSKRVQIKSNSILRQKLILRSEKSKKKDNHVPIFSTVVYDKSDRRRFTKRL